METLQVKTLQVHETPIRLKGTPDSLHLPQKPQNQVFGGGVLNYLSRKATIISSNYSLAVLNKHKIVVEIK
ncbi:MAG: hypothetical protein A2Y53_08790 [Chloroflexi bacterium RBG_16_47_49]|nr:MAG: hypothetical protein A2Y53_08790 [Chloroflexi bacterium RBG_16_47_49]